MTDIKTPPSDEDLPSREDIIRELRRYAWRYHKRCKGRGYTGQVEACSCALKRMRRDLKAAGLL